MANTREEEIQDAEKLKIEKVEIALNKIKNTESRVLIFIARGTTPSASVYEIYFHGKTLQNMGYNVTILTDVVDYDIPSWIEPELTDLPHEAMENAKLTVGTQDLIIIPEIFSNVMEQTKSLPCMRIGLLQSIDYMLNGLLPATDWTSFGIKDVITTSDDAASIMKEYYGKETFKIRVSAPGIPDYFQNNNDIKRPVISIVGRNPNEISKIVKLFYSKYPQFGWITFDSMITDSKPPSPLRRVDYAERLKKNFATVWVDRISTFGTVPLEAMKAGSIPIGLMPDITPEYLLDDEGEFIENSGVWTRDIYSLPILIGDLVTKFLDDTIDDKLFEVMTAIADKYSVSNATDRLEKIYADVFQTRVDLLQKVVDDYNKLQEVPTSIDEEAIKNEEITE